MSFFLYISILRNYVDLNNALVIWFDSYKDVKVVTHCSFIHIEEKCNYIYIHIHLFIVRTWQFIRTKQFIISGQKGMKKKLSIKYINLRTIFKIYFYEGSKPKPVPKPKKAQGCLEQATIISKSSSFIFYNTHNKKSYNNRTKR